MIPWLIRTITGARAQWVGVDPLDASGKLPQRIYFANHTTNVDRPVNWASLPKTLHERTRAVVLAGVTNRSSTLARSVYSAGI